MKKENVITSCCKISDDQFGKNYLTRNDFIRNEPVFAHTQINHQTVGFGLGYTVKTKNWIKNHPSIFMERDNNQDVFSHDNLSLISSLAVDKNHQKKGIGSFLMETMLLAFKEKGRPIIMAGWKKEDSVPIHEMATRFGFTKKLEIHHFWTDDSIRRGYTCAICGNPCRCSAILYVLTNYINMDIF